MNTATHESLDRLFKLLPAIHRTRDSEKGGSLAALLKIITEQVNIVEQDIANLYENWFIETCDDWVIPYIGDLIGYQVSHEAGDPARETMDRTSARNRILISRREIANTIRNRRRKGTLALLELMAADVADWPARAVEFYKLVNRFQQINQPVKNRGYLTDIRDTERLSRLDGPFDEVAHTVDVRRINSTRSAGRYGLSNIGLFVWRLRSYPTTESPAYCNDSNRTQYSFSRLSNDTQLFALPIQEPLPTHIAEEVNLPVPIRRESFAARTTDYYGLGKSLMIWLGNTDRKGQTELQPVPAEKIVSTDLTNWSYQAGKGQVAIDPQLGRIAFSQSEAPKDGVWVTFHQGFSADVGGGEYERQLSPLANRKLFKVSQNKNAEDSFQSIKEAINVWIKQREGHPDVVIEIQDSRSYTEVISFGLLPGERMEIRARNGANPAVRLLNYNDNKPDALQVRHEPATIGNDDKEKRLPRLVLDGLLIFGRGMQVVGEFESVTIRHCTLVPGWSLDGECNPESADEPSLELVDTRTRLQIDHSIVGTIHVRQSETITDPVIICVSDSIIDATSSEREALGTPGCPVAHATLTAERSTIIGRVETHAIQLAENSIFTGRIRVARTQLGCLRYCYVAPSSRTPRRFQCQPDLQTQNLSGAARINQELLARPIFTSERFGTHGYCQLATICPDGITTGADDQSEMGVFHDLYQPQRTANLRARLDEFTPSGSDAGIIFAT